MQALNPFNSPLALTYSNYTRLSKSGKCKTYQAVSPETKKSIDKISGHLQNFILTSKHPCIMARATMRSSSCRFGVYPALGSDEATAGLSRDLVRFLEERKTIKNPYASFMAVFPQNRKMSEKGFEKRLWQQLQLLHQASAPYFSWDNSTSPDPTDNNFGFSFGSKAFYVVGMHPNSSRMSRQFVYPMLVFNLHEQFEVLRDEGRYEKIKAVIRKNDLKLQGSNNPMLQDFGQGSEARQYSGRSVDNSWKCPYLASFAPQHEE